MRHFIPNIILFLFLVLLSNCKNQKTQIPEVKTDQWREDISGCNGNRKAMISSIININKEFEGSNEKTINAILGKPNETLLYERGQKFYLYYINCNNNDSLTQVLRMRFNALGYVNETLILEN
ncbi:MAG: hypothetical protein OCD76_05375 [Reichenbachiella sp.]